MFVARAIVCLSLAIDFTDFTDFTRLPTDFTTDFTDFIGFHKSARPGQKAALVALAGSTWLPRKLPLPPWLARFVCRPAGKTGKSQTARVEPYFWRTSVPTSGPEAGQPAGRPAGRPAGWLVDQLAGCGTPKHTVRPGSGQSPSSPQLWKGFRHPLSVTRVWSYGGPTLISSGLSSVKIIEYEDHKIFLCEMRASRKPTCVLW